MKKLIAIFGLLASSFSFGADWVYIGSSKAQDKFYVDFDYYNYNKISNKVRLWYKVEERHNEGYYTEQKTLAEYYCGDDRSKALSAIYYYPNGGVRKTFESNYLTESTAVFPDTSGEDIYKVACGTPGKGLDFKYLELDVFDDYANYRRASYAYIRQKAPQNPLDNIAPNLDLKNYTNYNDYSNDVKKELIKIRLSNIKKQYR